MNLWYFKPLLLCSNFLLSYLSASLVFGFFRRTHVYYVKQCVYFLYCSKKHTVLGIREGIAANLLVGCKNKRNFWKRSYGNFEFVGVFQILFLGGTTLPILLAYTESDRSCLNAVVSKDFHDFCSGTVFFHMNSDEIIRHYRKI